MTRRTKRALAGVGLALVAVACALGLSGRMLQTFAAPDAPVTEISHQEYQALLHTYVSDDGKVDYERWKDSATDVRRLDAYLSILTHATPETRPELFPAQPDRLAFWMNLYNALVLREILRRWPLASVTDVKINAGSYLSTGKGFFYDVEFQIGGQKMNLYDVENKIIRAQFNDARIHFAINCGSASCPLLRKDAFDAAGLSRQLEEASTQFVNDGKSVGVDEATRQIRMSKIFEWYTDDFVAFARAHGSVAQPTVLDFVLLYAKDPLATRLRAARTRGYAIVFLDYDWNVNQGAAPTAVSSAAPVLAAPRLFGGGLSVPEVELTMFSTRGGTVTPSTHRGKVVLIDFWATFCRPCKASFPRLQALSEKYQARGLVVLGVSEDESPESVVPAFLKETGAMFPIAVDTDQKAARAFKVTAMPTEVLIDRKGVVRFRHEGLGDGELDHIEAELQALLDEN